MPKRSAKLGDYGRAFDDTFATGKVVPIQRAA
jgi:hypothetical protein